MSIIGARGFVGKNARDYFSSSYSVTDIGRDTSEADLRYSIKQSDVLLFLASVQRETEDKRFCENYHLTDIVVDELQYSSKKTIIFTSSIHVEQGLNNEFVDSKIYTENRLQQLASHRVFIARLAHTVGKYQKPHYNSFVATLAHCISKGEHYSIDEPGKILNLVDIKSVLTDIEEFIEGSNHYELKSYSKAGYAISLRQLEELFLNPRQDFKADDFRQRLLSTYVPN